MSSLPPSGDGSRGVTMARGTIGPRGPGSPSAWRNANRDRILAALRTGGPMTQAQVTRVTGLASGTVSNIVAELRAQGVLERRGQASGRSPLFSGRQPGLVVGVDLDHRRLRVILADLSHTVLGEVVHELDVDHEVDEAVKPHPDGDGRSLGPAGSLPGGCGRGRHGSARSHRPHHR